MLRLGMWLRGGAGGRFGRKLLASSSSFAAPPSAATSNAAVLEPTAISIRPTKAQPHVPEALSVAPGSNRTDGRAGSKKRTTTATEPRWFDAVPGKARRSPHPRKLVAKEADSSRRDDAGAEEKAVKTASRRRSTSDSVNQRRSRGSGGPQAKGRLKARGAAEKQPPVHTAAEERLFFRALRIQDRDSSGDHPVPSFFLELLKKHPSLRKTGMKERVAFACNAWDELSPENRKQYVSNPLKGLIPEADNL